MKTNSCIEWKHFFSVRPFFHACSRFFALQVFPCAFGQKRSFLSNGCSSSFICLLQLTSGLSQLAQSYSAFHEGLVSYAGGVDALSTNWSSVYSGISSLASGAGELSDGVAALDEETSKIPELIDELTGGSTEDESADASAQASFLDERNGDTASVQFVIMTEGISEPEAEAEPAPAEEEQGFFAELWDRIVALFT